MLNDHRATETMQHVEETIETRSPAGADREPRAVAGPAARVGVPLPDLAVVITTKDSIRCIDRTLASVQGIAGRVLVVDSGSTDGTIEACRARGVEIVHRDWTGHVEQKQFAVDRCRDARWVLLLDSDESLERDLRQAVRAAVERDDADLDGWWVRRKTWFLGGWLHHTYQPEWRLRLVRGGIGRVVGTTPHDRLEVPGRTRRLDGVLRHDSWKDIEDLATRQVWYAQLTAEQQRRGGRVIDLLLSPPAAMLKQLIIKRGVLDGMRGLIVAGLTFNATMLKHAFIAARRIEERNAARARRRAVPSERTADE
jgi:hypothetical protein